MQNATASLVVIGLCVWAVLILPMMTFSAAAKDRHGLHSGYGDDKLPLYVRCREKPKTKKKRAILPYLKSARIA